MQYLLLYFTSICMLHFVINKNSICQCKASLWRPRYVAISWRSLCRFNVQCVKGEKRQLQSQLTAANKVCAFSYTYLYIGSPKIDIVAPFCFQSSILLRLRMNKLFVIWRVDISRHHCHCRRQRPRVSSTMQCVRPRTQTQFIRLYQHL